MRLGHSSNTAAKLLGDDMLLLDKDASGGSARIAQPERSYNPVKSPGTTENILRIAERLRAARLRAGYTSATAFARASGVPLSTYHCHENGARGIDADQAHFYSRALNVSISELLDVNELPAQTSAYIVGTIIDGGRAEAMNANPETSDSPADHTPQSTVVEFRPQIVALPDLTQMHAWRVGDNSMSPVYRAGDVIFHRHPVFTRPLLRKLHGQECLVELDSGEKMLRQVTMGTDGLATLIAYVGRPLYRVNIVSAAFIALVLRTDNPLQ